MLNLAGVVLFEVVGSCLLVYCAEKRPNIGRLGGGKKGGEEVVLKLFNFMFVACLTATAICNNYISQL